MPRAVREIRLTLSGRLLQRLEVEAAQREMTLDLFCSELVELGYHQLRDMVPVQVDPWIRQEVPEHKLHK